MLIMKTTMFSAILLLLAANCFATIPPEYYYFDTSRTVVKTVYDGNGKVIGMQEYKAMKVLSDIAYGSNTITKCGKDTEITESYYFVDEQGLKIAMGKDASGKEVFLDYREVMNSGNNIIGFETTTRLAGNDVRVSCTISNRKITALTETVSSEAGTWNCIRTEYDMELRGRFFGIGIPVNVHIVEWFAPETGIVRTDIYKRGKLHETRLLTGFCAIH